MAEKQADPIKAGDRVRFIEGTPHAPLLVKEIVIDPQMGPIAMFEPSGYWRCSALVKVTAGETEA